MKNEFKRGETLTVEPYFEDIPLGEFLQAYTPIDSRRKLQKLVDRGVIEVNGITRPLDFMLQSGDEVRIGSSSQERDRSYPDPEVLMHRDQLLIFHTYPGQFHADRRQGTVLQDTDLSGEVLANLPVPADTRYFPVYEVPSGASGLVLLAEDETTRDQWRDRIGDEGVELTGLAIVDGVVRSERTVEEPVGASEHDQSVYEAREDGQPAKTDVNVETTFRKFSLISVRPRSAVPHQERVHLSYVHHPLSVDRTYGYREKLKLSEFKEDYREKPFQEERPLIARTSLHWKRIDLTGSTGNEGDVFEVDPPEDFQITVKQLRNHGS